MAVDSLVNPPLLKEGGRIFIFDFLHMHIGSMYDTDAPLTCTFPFRNVSGRNVRITKITNFVWVYGGGHSVREALAPGMESGGDIGRI